MGIYLYNVRRAPQPGGLPHAGGDIPQATRGDRFVTPAAPRGWGYTYLSRDEERSICGCPTRVGIYPVARHDDGESDRLPHAGGDIPTSVAVLPRKELAAPRGWGYTAGFHAQIYQPVGCPTRVGIYLRQLLNERKGQRLPHAGGDIPDRVERIRVTNGAAPRGWGYTPAKH